MGVMECVSGRFPADADTWQNCANELDFCKGLITLTLTVPRAARKLPCPAKSALPSCIPASSIEKTCVTFCRSAALCIGGWRGAGSGREVRVPATREGNYLIEQFPADPGTSSCRGLSGRGNTTDARVTDREHVRRM